MIEPDFIYQCGEPMTPKERMAWLEKVAFEATNRGGRFGRASVHPEMPNLTLFECWKVRPEDQGEQRWQMTSLA